MSMVCHNFGVLLEAIKNRKVVPDIIVVEGYNAVGKGRVLRYLQENLSADLYRPTYTDWLSQVPRSLRWTVFASFVDFLSCLSERPKRMILCDRGFLSGVVYNNDITMLRYWKGVKKNFNILHILVTCSEEDYQNFLLVRGSEKELSYHEYLKYTERYRLALQIIGTDHIEFVNKYEENYGKVAGATCLGCSHYALGVCNNEKSPHYRESSLSELTDRCEYARTKEVQDRNGAFVV